MHNLGEIMTSWRNVFDQVLHTFGGWPSLESSSQPNIRIRIERLYGIMVDFQIQFLINLIFLRFQSFAQIHFLKQQFNQTTKILTNIFCW